MTATCALAALWLLLVPGVRMIDVSAVNASLVGHSAFADAPRVIQDIAKQLAGRSPEERRLRRPKTGQDYWVID